MRYKPIWRGTSNRATMMLSKLKERKWRLWEGITAFTQCSISSIFSNCHFTSSTFLSSTNCRTTSRSVQPSLPTASSGSKTSALPTLSASYPWSEASSRCSTSWARVPTQARPLPESSKRSLEYCLWSQFQSGWRSLLHSISIGLWPQAPNYVYLT